VTHSEVKINYRFTGEKNLYRKLGEWKAGRPRQDGLEERRGVRRRLEGQPSGEIIANLNNRVSVLLNFFPFFLYSV